MSETDKIIRYLPALDKDPAKLIIPAAYFVPWMICFFLSGLITAGLMSVGISFWMYVPTCLTLMGIHFILIGEKPWLFMGNLHRPMLRENANSKFRPTTKKLKHKIPNKKRGKKKRKRILRAAENDIDLATMLDFNLHGERVGAFLLQRGQRFQIVWVYDSEGLPPTLSKQQARAVAEKIHKGFKDLHLKHPVTMHMGSFANCDQRVAQIETLGENAPSPELEFMCAWDAARVKRLTEMGKYNPKFLRFYVTHDVGVNFTEKHNFFDLVGQWFVDKFNWVRQRDYNINDRLYETLTAAFDNSYYKAINFFEKCGLPAAPIEYDPLWALTYRRFNNGPIPEVPQVIHINENGIRYERNNELQIASVLLGEAPLFGDQQIYGKGHASSAVYLPGIKKYVGAAVLDGRFSRSYHEEEGRLEQLLDGAQPLNSKGVHDTELVVTFTAEKQGQLLRKAQAKTGQSSQSKNISEAKGGLDIGARFNVEKASEIEWALREGAITVKIAWTAFVYRDTPRQLNRAVDDFCSQSLFAGGVVKRELGYCDELYLNSLPVTMEQPLTECPEKLASGFDRQIRETTESAPGMMPLTYSRRSDQEGIELLSPSGTPMLVDPLGRLPHNHLLFLAKVRQGKSTLVGECKKNVQLRGGQVLIIDAGREDNSGTFDTEAEFTDCALFSAGKDSYNLFEGVDFSQLLGEPLEYALEAFRGSLIDAITILTTTEDDDTTTVGDHRNIATNLINLFLESEPIQIRYRAAFRGGRQSPEWEQIPCLPDFVDFMSADLLPVNMQNDTTSLIVQRMKVSLSALMQRTVGKALGRPSTFDINAPSIVFAVGKAKDDTDMEPLLLSVQAAILSISLSPRPTWIVAEEATHLWKHKSYRDLVNRLVITGPKADIWLAWVGQSLAILQEYPESKTLIHNIGTYLVGAISSSAIDDLVAAEKSFDPDLLANNALKSFNPPQKVGAKRWLIHTEGESQIGDHFPSWATMALLMSNQNEVILRKELMAQAASGNKFTKISLVAHHLREQSIDSTKVR